MMLFVFPAFLVSGHILRESHGQESQGCQGSSLGEASGGGKLSGGRGVSRSLPLWDVVPCSVGSLCVEWSLVTEANLINSDTLLLQLLQRAARVLQL